MLIHRPKLRHRSPSQGQALVELALVTTVLVLLLVGALDLGRVFYSQITVTDAAKEGALVASQGGTYVANATCDPDTNTVMCGVVSEAQGGFVQVVPSNVAATTCPAQPNSSTPPVTVTVKAPFTAITPIIAAILSGNGGYVTGTASTPCRYVPTFALSGSPNPNPSPAPVAFFIVNPTSGTAPLNNVQVTDASTGSPTGWTWDFGDGTPLFVGQNPPLHTYGLAGTYHLKLTVSNANGTSLPAIQDVTVTPVVVVPPVAAFTATPMTGNNPLPVTVTDNSSGTPTSWAWTFGDGQTSSVQNPPAHTYASPGTYTITLTATNSAGPSSPATKQIVVNDSCPSPVANFTYSQQNKNKPVDFVGSLLPATCAATQWAWDFGDGGAQATGQILSHAYPLQGHNYTVTLSVTTAAGNIVKIGLVTTK